MRAETPTGSADVNQIGRRVDSPSPKIKLPAKLPTSARSCDFIFILPTTIVGICPPDAPDAPQFTENGLLSVATRDRKAAGNPLIKQSGTVARKYVAGKKFVLRTAQECEGR